MHWLVHIHKHQLQAEPRRPLVQERLTSSSQSLKVFGPLVFSASIPLVFRIPPEPLFFLRFRPEVGASSSPAKGPRGENRDEMSHQLQKAGLFQTILGHSLLRLGLDLGHITLGWEASSEGLWEFRKEAVGFGNQNTACTTSSRWGNPHAGI